MTGESQPQNELESEVEKPKNICPKCGMRGSFEYRRVGDQTYVYCHHKIRKMKKTKRGVREVTRQKTCYLGPQGYIYVEKFNPLGLGGLMDEDRFYDYALSIIDRLKPDQLITLKEHIEHRLASTAQSTEMSSKEGGDHNEQ